MSLKSTITSASQCSQLPNFDTLNFREFSFSNNFEKLKLNHSWEHSCYTYFLHRSSFENEYLIGICLPRLHFSKKETNCFWKRPPSLHKLANNLPMRNDAGAGKWSSRRQVKWTTTDVFFYEKVRISEFSENWVPNSEFEIRKHLLRTMSLFSTWCVQGICNYKKWPSLSFVKSQREREKEKMEI